LRVKLAILFHFLPWMIPLSWVGPVRRTGRPPTRISAQTTAVSVPQSRESYLDQTIHQRLGHSLSPRRFVLFLRRLLLFLSKLDHNKFVRIGEKPRMDLYVPSFPSPAFYWGARKFTAFDRPLPCVTALISVTSACRFSCEHCYQRLDKGHDVALDKLIPVVRLLQNQGVSFFNIEGGEPFLVYDRLREVCAAIDQRSEIWVNSTGDGMTLERLKELRELNLTAVMFSLHTAEASKLNSFMGSPKAWDTLARGVELCHEAGVPVAFNACLARDAFYNGEFEKVMDRARAFNACVLQLIKPKPAGAWLNSGAATFNAADLEHMTAFVRRYNHSPDYASYPAISAQALIEHSSRFGCTAGGVDRFYINAKGDVQPCEFLNISFGNIAREDFSVIYERMRNAFSPACESWLCEACAPAIRSVFQARHLKSLPLDQDASAEICRAWNRGNPTPFYTGIKDLS
jgi:MoaA/NifB/PqqE/SkfB family radical SAM enzyme